MTHLSCLFRQGLDQVQKDQRRFSLFTRHLSMAQTQIHLHIAPFCPAVAAHRRKGIISQFLKGGGEERSLLEGLHAHSLSLQLEALPFFLALDGVPK